MIIILNDDNLSVILQNSRLNIIQYNIDEYGKKNKNRLDQRNRIFNHYSLSYMKEGVSRIRIYEQDYYAYPGDAILIPPNVKHDHVTDSDDLACFMWWNFTYKLYDVIDILCMQNLPVVIHIDDREKFEKTFNHFIEQSNNLNNISDYVMKESIALELIALLFEMILSETNDKDQWAMSGFVDILADITKNPTCKKLLSMLSEKYNLHPTYISNKFKQIYNITPIQYQKQIRMKKAADLLLGNTLMSINEISLELGYEYPADFSRFFKQQYGISPIQYRKRSEYKHEAMHK